jgi:hypothetical protein
MAAQLYNQNTGQYAGYMFYNCAPTEGTNMIYMKDSNGIAIPKGFIVHTNNTNTNNTNTSDYYKGKLFRIISDSNNETELCFIT